jgi:hypothetical protein
MKTSQIWPISRPAYVLNLGLILLGLLFSAKNAGAQWTPQMDFASATAPYKAFTYNINGYVAKCSASEPDGKVAGNALGCSGYASIVLHRMRFGSAWKSNYSLKVHQNYGGWIAGHFGLTFQVSLPAADINDATKISSLLAETNASKPHLRAGLYFFDVRAGRAGHVGFLQIQSNGTLAQSHYSQIPNGLATGNQLKLGTAYSNSHVDLYIVTQP